MLNEPLDPTGPVTPSPRRGGTPARSGTPGGLGRSLPEIFDLVPRAKVTAEAPATLDQELVLRELNALRHDLRAIEERLVHLMIDLAQSAPSGDGGAPKPTPSEPAQPEQHHKAKKKAKKKNKKSKAKKQATKQLEAATRH